MHATRLCTAAVAACTAATLLTPGSAVAIVAAGPAAPPQLVDRHVVATFEPTSPDLSPFAEALAIDQFGNVFTSVTTFDANGPDVGRILRTTRGGHTEQFGPTFGVDRLGTYGLLTGVVVTGRDVLVAAATDASFGLGSKPLPSVVVIDRSRPNHVRTLTTLPEGVFPNGIALHRGDLYVADSNTGDIYRVHRGRATVWVRDSLLAPTGNGSGLGANNLLWMHNTLFVTVSDAGAGLGRVVAVNGRTRAVRAVATSPYLAGADGVARGPGGLWIAVNGQWTDNGSGRYSGERQGLVMLTPANQVVPVVTDAAWMNYPTSVGFTPGRHPRGYLTNGAFYGGQPVSDLMTFRVKA